MGSYLHPCCTGAMLGNTVMWYSTGMGPMILKDPGKVALRSSMLESILGNALVWEGCGQSLGRVMQWLWDQSVGLQSMLASISDSSNPLLCLVMTQCICQIEPVICWIIYTCLIFHLSGKEGRICKFVGILMKYL